MIRVDEYSACLVSINPDAVYGADDITAASFSLSTLISNILNCFVPVLTLVVSLFGTINEPEITPSPSVSSVEAPSGCVVIFFNVFPKSESVEE